MVLTLVGVCLCVLGAGAAQSAAASPALVSAAAFGAPIRGIEFGMRGKEPHIRNRLSVTDCQVVDGAPALRLLPGAVRANVHHNHFQSVAGEAGIRIDKGADLLVVTDNVLTSDRPIDDASGASARKVVKDNLVETSRKPATRPRPG